MVVGPYVPSTADTQGIAVTPEPAHPSLEIPKSSIRCSVVLVLALTYLKRYSTVTEIGARSNISTPRTAGRLLSVRRFPSATGPLVRQWPDAHAEGWARRYVLDRLVFGERARDAEALARHSFTLSSRVRSQGRRRVLKLVRYASTLYHAQDALGGLRVDDSNRLLRQFGTYLGYRCDRLAGINIHQNVRGLWKYH